jgi:hypothetical protein
MTIWAFKDPKNEPELTQYVIDSLDKGESRFGWGFIPEADLTQLSKKQWNEMDDDEKKCWGKSNFLLGVTEGDWIVHVNIPTFGMCTAAKVNGPYRFDLNESVADFGHCFSIDLSTKVIFDRNDFNVHPRVSRSLKPRQRFQRIYYVSEFEESIKAISSGKVILNNNERKGTAYLKTELAPSLKDISELIHRNYPGKDLESFVKDIFENIDGVSGVRVNGSGWGTDYGADVIVEYRSGLPISELVKDEILVVQVKSFGWTMSETTAISQIRTALVQFDADAGMIIASAEPSKDFQDALEKLRLEVDQPIALIAGANLAKFVLKYGGDLLFDL